MKWGPGGNTWRITVSVVVNILSVEENDWLRADDKLFKKSCIPIQISPNRYCVLGYNSVLEWALRKCISPYKKPTRMPFEM